MRPLLKVEFMEPDLALSIRQWYVSRRSTTFVRNLRSLEPSRSDQLREGNQMLHRGAKLVS